MKRLNYTTLKHHLGIESSMQSVSNVSYIPNKTDLICFAESIVQQKGYDNILDPVSRHQDKFRPRSEALWENKVMSTAVNNRTKVIKLTTQASFATGIGSRDLVERTIDPSKKRFCITYYIFSTVHWPMESSFVFEDFDEEHSLASTLDGLKTLPVVLWKKIAPEISSDEICC